MRVLDIFRGFMSLKYKPGEKRLVTQDITLGTFILGRLKEDKLIIIYLYNGNKFSIPIEWLSLFKQLRISSGTEISYVNDYPSNEEEKYLETIIRKFIKLESQLENIDGERSDFLDTLASICELKTHRFIKYLADEFEVELEPLKLEQTNDDDLYL